MEELRSAEDVVAATADSLVRWGSQSLAEGYPNRTGYALRHRSAIGVYAAGLNRRDRFLVTGEPADCAELVRAALRTSSPSTRILGAADTIRALVTRLPECEPLNQFGWMELPADAGNSTVDTSGVRWLADTDLPAVHEVLTVGNPDSWVRPYDFGARRWAGVSTSDGRLAAVAADAWPSPSVGFIGGVATESAHRGRGLATAVCGFVRDALRAEHRTVTLMVDGSNNVAVRMYRRLGFSYRDIAGLRLAAR